MRLEKVTAEILDRIKFDDRGLVPAIIQDAETSTVLMMAYMNREALEKSLTTGQTWFYSRSRRQLWHKGETSGHYQHIQEVYYDCDADTLLFRVKQEGVACHEGYYSCFHHRVKETGEVETVDSSTGLATILDQLYDLIQERKDKRPEGSYTSYLFNQGQDKILKKLGEEAAEVIIASKNDKREEVIYEVADLLYHLLVLLAYHDISPDEVREELRERRK
ncbi:bifunctional phosphoribosyl-AMP cyclohydrolase/phosphoribosyl-ATP diphosphatase HisIE [Calderihabitans maritimus]|uniref:Histidine biosynthesis bifunctional protein HisIE n=1 Tax=Calderihabitans maritimus TaxID=1246530 RepID=A0A1Z5HQG8_9FIRM|nr:bifunctional phosphoribosyl-AMP cyclohydrolase/phosphoribosyl-ATP diphosphatase HisIE [Calderihabitans maritimus]GAW91555.1 phosphoribosyl-ATP pyrophosphatase [Calderihabitans maritimus]